MLMPLPQLIKHYGIKINGVLHVGAHLAEEAEIYRGEGIANVWWVEGNPAVIPHLEAKTAAFGHHLIHALVYAHDGAELDFNVTNYDGMSSSILEFGTHPTFSPDTVFVDKVTLSSRCIDSLVAEHGIVANFLNMDLQGAELFALQGAADYLHSVDYVMTEINKAEVYKGCARVEQLDEFLGAYGMERVETQWVAQQGWGDGLYIRR